MSQQKILVVTYYWPPSGGSGVQRWLKFVKYLPQLGCKPYVVTPQNPALVQRDESLLSDVSPEAEIIRLPIWEPYTLFFTLSGAAKKERVVKPSQLSLQKKKTVFQQLASWVRGNLFIPDPKIGWVRPTVKFLHAYLKEHQINNIVTTGPPHSMHLIGLKLKEKNPALNWIADFRDPWSEWSFLESFAMTQLVKARHRKLEQRVLTRADHVLTITPYYVKRFEALSKRSVELVPNGFDHEDFQHIVYTKPARFTLRHVGIVYDMADPGPLRDALVLLQQRIPNLHHEFVLEFVGEVNPSFRASLEQPATRELLAFKPPVPHKQLMTLYGETSMLLLNLEGYKQAEGLLPGKLFEYLATGLPVLGIGPVAGNAAELLNATGAGVMFEKTAVPAIADFIELQYQRWKRSEPARVTSTSQAYSRRALTQKVVSLLR